MKRTILGTAGLALALFALAGDAAAQRPMRLGVIGGYNLASLSGDDVDDDVDSKGGFDIGGLIQIPMGDMITIQPEVHYSQRGAASEEGEIALDYIHVPILFKAGLPLAEGFDFDFLFGPSLAFNMGCDFEPDEGDSVECEDAGFGEVKGFDWGIIGGGSFAWAAGPGDVLIDVRYDWGMSDIIEVPEGADDADVSNTALQFLIGYAFPL